MICVVFAFSCLSSAGSIQATEGEKKGQDLLLGCKSLPAMKLSVVKQPITCMLVIVVQLQLCS